MVKNFVLVFIIVLINNKSSGQIDNSQNTKDSILVNNELNEFVESFKNLDFVNFQAFFADDVTVFFPPSSMTAQRINGKEKVMAVFKTFFDKVKINKTSPPYLDIDPKKMEISVFQNIAIVTFELKEKNALSRRTIILKKQNGKFLIIHLHASRIENLK